MTKLKSYEIAGVAVLLAFLSAVLVQNAVAMAICASAIYIGCCITSIRLNKEHE